jgi:hypothetical protein
MNESSRNPLATVLRLAAALALALLLLGAAGWSGAALARRLGVALLLAAPWIVVLHAAWAAWRGGRRATALVALALLAAAAAALALARAGTTSHRSETSATRLRT